jgi:cation diffusion facilitator CzcD-associated flavoprotein CzcO
MTVTAKAVAVIGAGPAGAIAIDALVREQAFKTVRVFDRRVAIDGTWYVVLYLIAVLN